MEERKTEVNGTDSESSIPVAGNNPKPTSINNSASEKDVVLNPNKKDDSTPSSEQQCQSSRSHQEFSPSPIPSDLQLTNAATTATSASEQYAQKLQQKKPTFKPEDSRGIQFADENGGVLYETIYPTNLHYAKQREDESEIMNRQRGTNKLRCCIVS
uniref:Uncharacterized protein n=1 Tax=Aplanochytrium stocchinoi TaxID=215587 RepID=A0A7S3PME8_9STRA|mmetsp:Transcript_16098/g.19168  ORF Transcript_16098/g.19168 Transcript_16098/m.19168 type:complete len:157 (+) Transcript_16098:294-764(+)|eukprot:CAMPEP_0204827986 /NCGR_PEP_ID=MMETSP1346-20131115/5548_1 /ASSEMBLY_ACC=CAM_ASM_000771 /TAXON_ID=215587 /ORGANISM="Aplanochytrium stocchinoi, Strain GSBS06" /LENGTH=156 /DNA_ID=CAMNT_0051956707 /DNA_START=239 /DNA_END=709 /DNA_ORIENTATION=+